MAGKKTDRGDKNTLRTTIKNHILNCINDGTYKPGDRIVETRLAKELNVSQAPVREAILELSIMGVLEERPFSGSFVRKHEPGEVEDYFSARAYLEEYAIKRAAKYRREEELDEMEEILERMAVCKNKEDFTVVDHEFHEKIMDAARNNYLKRAWESLQIHDWTYESTLKTKHTLKELTQMHRELFESIREQRDHTAGAQMFLHIHSFGEALIARLNKNGQSTEG